MSYTDGYSRQDRLDNVLFAAVQSGEPARIEYALAQGGDIDAAGGKPLRSCAERKDYKTARFLFVKGADIDYALLKTQEELDDFSAKYVLGLGHVTLDSKDQPRYDGLKRTLITLQDYKRIFMESVLPVEQVRKLDLLLENQQRMAAQIERLRREIDDIVNPKDIGKAPAKGLKGNTPT